MFARSTTHPYPTAILKTADSTWKAQKTRKFFGYSYLASTPTIATIQQLGLGITKAFTTHIRNATQTSPSMEGGNIPDPLVHNGRT
jgi:hypothetical protein